MQRIWTIAKKILFPGWKWALPLAALSAAALLFVFSRGLQESPAAYAAYPVSFYALIALTEAAVRTGRSVWRRVSAVPLVERWRRDGYFRVHWGLVLSLLVNLCYAGLRIVCAVRYASFWDGALGLYYVLLCALRIYLIRRMPDGSGGVPYAAELRTYRNAGWLLVGLGLALAGIAVQIVQDGQGYNYPGTLIYAAAAYSFYCLTMAVVNAVKYRRFRSPVLSAAKAVSLTTALVSIFSLETAMLAQFGGEARFQQVMTASTAAAVCALVLGIALYMVLSAGRKRKQL